MVLSFHDPESGERLYLQVYHYYRELIMSRRLPPGSRMPSLRSCARGTSFKQDYHRKRLSAACGRTDISFPKPRAGIM